MTDSRSGRSVKVSLLRVGLEVIPVCGDDHLGWSIDSGLQTSPMPIYRTLEELYFALLNMQLSTEGSA